jgi:hypothetical protein
MESTLAHPAIPAPARDKALPKAVPSSIRQTVRRLLAAIVEGGETTGWRASPPAAAQFSLLPSAQQNRLLDLGFRP